MVKTLDCGSGDTGSIPVHRPMYMTIIKLDERNRMIRIGFGKHNNKWFARVDLWWYGIRIS